MKTLFLDLFAIMHGRGPQMGGWKTAALISLIIERTGARLIVFNASLSDYSKYYLVKEIPYYEWLGECDTIEDYVSSNDVDDYFVIRPEDESWRHEWQQELEESPTKEEWKLKLGELMATLKERSEVGRSHVYVCPWNGMEWKDADKVLAQWE